MPDTVPTGSAAEAWLTPPRFAALLAVFVFASWPQVFLGLQTFVFRDFGYYAYPIAHYLRESFWRGEIPLWNPLNHCGSPFLAEWNTQVLYPPALFYVIFPLSWSLAVFCLLHLYLGGLGLFFLARRWSGNNLAAAVAGIAFAFNGLMINSLMWPGTIPGFGWMPWLVWLAERAWREGGRVPVLAAVVGAVQMLSGAVEVILMTWIVIGTLGVVDFAAGKYPRSKMVGRGALVVALVTGLCAAQLLPFRELLNNSNRQENFDAAAWPMPLTGWANFLVPLFHTHSSFHGVYLQPHQNWTYSYYVGVFTVALAALAPALDRRRRTWVLAALTLLCLVLALGPATPLYGWCRQYVFFVKLMRFPVKFVILPVFTLPLLAAFALAAKTDPRRRRKMGSAVWPAVWLGVVGLMAGILWCQRAGPETGDDWSATWHNAALRGLFFTGLIAAWRGAEKISVRSSRRLLQLLLLVLLWLDVSYHAPQPKTVNRPIYEPGMLRELPAPRLGESRAMVSHKGNSDFSFSFIPDVGADYVSRRFGLFSNCNLLDGIPKVDGFYPLQVNVQRQIHLLLYAQEAPDPAPEPLLDFLGARQITSETNIFEWTPRPNFMPMITGGQQPVFLPDDKVFWSLGYSNFNPRAEVFMSPLAQPFVAITHGTAVKISDPHFAAQHIEAKVDAAAPALVVIAQTFYQPWRAYVDGQPVKLLRANYAFQAVVVPAGRHGLNLVYEDRQFYLGAIISLATGLVCVVAWGWLGRNQAAPAN